MKSYYKLLNMRALLFGPLALLLASCGSYQYAGYEHDGIYSSGSTPEAYAENDTEESYENALYYQQAFAQQAEELEMATQGNPVFTDIDSYSSGTYDVNAYADDQLAYQGQAYGGWGDQADEISINIYGNPYMHGYGGFYDPFYYGGYYDPFYGPHYGYGYPGYGYGYGHHSPWRFRTGWGYNHWGYAGYGYNPYYYGGHYYGNPTYQYYNSNVVHNNSRRNSYSDYTRNQLRSSKLSDSRSSVRAGDYSNSRDVRATSRSNRDNTISRSTRATNDNRTYRTSRTSRVSSPATTRSNSTYRTPTTRSSSPTYQSNSRSTRSTPAVRSSTPTRSSGTVRSSSSSTRSSGTSSSSRSSRGRGN